MSQHGGGYVPGSNRPYAGPQAHGGGYVPGQQPHRFPKPPPQPSQQLPQPPQQPAYQSQGIAYNVSRHAPEPGFIESKSEDRPSSEEVDEYNDTRIAKKKPVHLKGILHFFDTETRYRHKKPHLYKPPVFRYDATQIYRHRDVMGRVFKGPMDDRYLSPWDGHLAKVHVQATDEIYDARGTTTWRRTYIRNVAPMNVRIATWAIDFSVDPQSWKDWGIVLLRFIPASFAMTFFVVENDSATPKDGLKYAPLPYKFYGYPKAARNQLENAKTNMSPRTIDPANQVTRRLLNPRYLCFLKRPEDTELWGAVPMLVSNWQAQHESDNNAVLNYLFIAYSAEQFNHGSTEDMEALHQIAERATRDAHLSAYWVACSCMPDARELEEDVYRISDIMRGAKGMVIALGAPSNTSGATTRELLRHWGRRMWTFPEVLLSQNDEVSVYVRPKGGRLDSPLVIPKSQFAAEVWTDAVVSRELIDHYKGSLVLSRLELVILALGCLQSRQTTQYLPGDHSYALMGLLRLRPKVDRRDTAFQAFARLSLMNDSDMLLERVICTLPKSPRQDWHEMDDAYGCSLWDIYPKCQVAGIGEDDTVIIDGAYGTSIRWKSFHRIWSARRLTWKRWFAWKLLHTASTFLLIGIVLIGLGFQENAPHTESVDTLFGEYSYTFGSNGIGNTNIGIGIILLLFGLTGWIMAPRLLQIILRGKFWDTQAAVLGFEGYMNLPTIERCIFGGNFNRLSWSTNGSPLSRHRKNDFGECEGIDPTDDIDIRNLVEKSKAVGPGEQRIFTIVDTYSMEVTMFQAANPPIALLICGSEGGMKRAIGCSYDWTTGTLYRETVLRMPTPALNRMDRTDKIKLGLKRPDFKIRT